MASRTTGLRERHSRRCNSRDGGGCNCVPSCEAWVYSARHGCKLYKTFSGKGAKAAAKDWRADATHALRRGRLRPATRKTVRQAAEELIAGMRDGSIQSARKRPYKPATIRSYERALGLTLEQRERAPERVLERLGDYRLSELDRETVEDYAKRLSTAGYDWSTVHNHLDPLRVIYRRARRAGVVAIDPLEDLDLGRPQGKRERIASPTEAAALLEALADDDRALWSTAFYAGLRRGELRALRWHDVDLRDRTIHVERSWDDQEGEQDAKTEAGDRRVPIIGALLPELRDLQMRSGRRGTDLVFGVTVDQPFDPTTMRRRALAAWEVEKLASITPHEARHTFASMLIAAGVDIKAVSEYMGHASIQITVDRYGHLYKDAHEQAVRRVDAFLASHTPALVAVD